MDLYEHDEGQKDKAHKEKVMELRSKYLNLAERRDTNKAFVDIKMRLRKAVADLNE